MKPVRILIGVVLVATILTLISCDPGFGPEITNVRADDPAIAPGATTVLHCEVDNPDSATLTYVWEADDGTIQNLGDSAVWTAPDDMTWTSYTVTVTVTVGDEAGNTDADNLDLQVAVTSQTVYADEDTYTFEHDPDTNYADVIEMMVGHSDNYPGEFFRGFLRFATPAISDGESLQGARIHLTREWGMGEECQLAIELITEDWQGSSVTWNTAPTSENWVTINDDVSDKGAFYFEVTSLVADWLDGSRDNYGFMLRLNDESGSDEAFRSYVTIEDADENERPVLEVVSW